LLLFRNRRQKKLVPFSTGSGTSSKQQHLLLCWKLQLATWSLKLCLL